MLKINTRLTFCNMELVKKNYILTILLHHFVLAHDVATKSIRATQNLTLKSNRASPYVDYNGAVRCFLHLSD